VRDGNVSRADSKYDIHRNPTGNSRVRTFPNGSNNSQEKQGASGAPQGREIHVEAEIRGYITVGGV
jgi:hypothetical protein